MRSGLKLWLIGILISAGAPAGWTQTENATAPPTTAPAVNMDRVRLLQNSARDAVLKGNNVEAERYLAEMVAIAYQAWEIQDGESSGAIFRQVLNLKPDYPQALFGLAELYRRTNPIWAVEYYSRYLREYPNDGAAYYGRGSCYLMRDAFSLAIQDLQYLVDRLEPNHVGGLTNLALALRGRSLERNHDVDLFKQAVDTMQRAARLAQQSPDPENRNLWPEIQYRLARMTLEYEQILSRARATPATFTDSIGSLHLALNAAVEVVNRNPESREALNQVLLVYDTLAELYQTQIQATPGQTTPYLNLAKVINDRAMVRQRDSKIRMLGLYRQALQANPNSAEIWALKAKIHAELGMISQAIEAIDQALTLAPENPDYRQTRARWVASTQPAEPATEQTQ